MSMSDRIHFGISKLSKIPVLDFHSEVWEGLLEFMGSFCIYVSCRHKGHGLIPSIPSPT